MKKAIWVAVIGALGATLAAGIPPLVNLIENWVHPTPPPPPPITEFSGVVMRDDANPERRFPIHGVQVAATNGVALSPVTTDSNGLFKLLLKPEAKSGAEIDLDFTGEQYQERDVTAVIASDVPFVVYLWPSTYAEASPASRSPWTAAQFTPVADNQNNILSKTFVVPNRGSVRCHAQPCSPDGKWQATIASASLDAGPGKVFSSGHADCIAGPCPWTEIVINGLGTGKRQISVSVKDWSDTVTYKLWGEVTAAPPTAPRG